MPTLAELKDKWFIPMDGASQDGVPRRRHARNTGINALSVSTDGNIVQRLVDGQRYQREWHDALLALHGAPGAEFFHAGWRFEDVYTLGVTTGGPHALQSVVNAHAAGVRVYPLLCRNVANMWFNQLSLLRLRAKGVSTAVRDRRSPAWGANHQKFAVMKTEANALAFVGSIDVSKTRWDTTEHLAVNPDRDPTYGKQTHDTGVLVQGPAVGDIEKTFRERWNDSSRTFGMAPLLPSQPLITSPMASSPANGTLSVQVLRTYGLTNAVFGYSWHASGEFTVWASYLNAIKRASKYIYVEDQNFLPFDWPPCYNRTGTARDTDIIYQLGEAMKRGVKVAILTLGNEGHVFGMYRKYQRDIGVNYLRSIRGSLSAGSTGDLVVASMKTGTSDVYVHSKLMIIDDEFVSIGSANVGQRSMTHDSELHLGIVDRANVFAKEFRKEIWSELTGRGAATLDDPAVAYGLFKADMAASSGHLKPYPVDPLAVYPAVAGSKSPPIGHRIVIRRIDSYAGPAGIR